MRAVLLMAAGAGLLAAQNPAGSIEGVVLDAVTHAPVKRAVVMTWSHAPIEPPPAAESSDGLQQSTGMRISPGQMRQVSVRTDANGKFALRDLPAGMYQVNVTHMHYLNSRGPESQAVELKGGEKANVTFELTPGATISGRVVDEDGDPMSGCMAQLLPARAGEYAGVMGSQSARADSG